MKKKLRIAQVAPLWFPIPPKKYGGVERIVHYLTEGLVKKGHNVTLFASGDSKTKAKLVPGWPQSLNKEKIKGKPISWKNSVFPLLNISQAFEQAHKFDIIHIHENKLCLSNFFTSFIKTPVVITIHDEFPTPEFKSRWALFTKYKKNNYISISKSHQKLGKKIGINFVDNIYNGIDFSLFKFNKNKGEHLTWLGRSAAKKGAEEAIIIAKKAKEKLLLAGRIDVNSPVSLEYYRNHMKPYFNKNIKYIGEVNDSQKNKFLGNAKALLYPISWEEPFGLVMAEALACGTPVIVFDRGSAREVIKDGKTGFIVKNIREAVAAVKKIDQIDRRDCRKWVEENFSIEKMVDNYEKVYYKVLKK